jgi:hypothetical protein
MAIDPDQPDVVLEALRAADGVDARGIDAVADGEVLVLRGTVATFEQSSAAQLIAEQHGDRIRNELHVDVNFREGLEDGAEPTTTRPSESLRSSSFNPVEEPDDLVGDMQHALEENLSWDAPHEYTEVPTRAEERGLADRSAPDDEADDNALLADVENGAKSLPDLSPEELSRAAHPQPRDEEKA